MSITIEEINQGDEFMCLKTFEIHGHPIFIQGNFYTSNEDHCITDENGTHQFGWNLDVLNTHFYPILEDEY